MFYEEMKKTENSNAMWDFWQTYRDELTTIILSNIESYGVKKELTEKKMRRLSGSVSKESFLYADRKPTLAIWGAGGCNDIDVKKLSEYFQLILIDCELDRVEDAVKRYDTSDSCKCVDLKFWDVSDDEYHMFEAMLRDGTDVKEIGEYLLEISEKMLSYNHEKFCGFDYSVIVGLASQLNARFMALFDIYCDEKNFSNVSVKKIYSEEEKTYIAGVVMAMNQKAVKAMFDMAIKLTNKLIIFGYEALSSEMSDDETLEEICKNINDEREEKIHANHLPEWIENSGTEIMGCRELEEEIKSVLKKKNEIKLFDYKGIIWNFTPVKKYLMLSVTLEKGNI